MAEQYSEVQHANIYCTYRKDTAEEIVERIISCLKEKYKGPLEYAVDVACGSGQSSVPLAPYFKEVYGIDGSESQIKQAKNKRKRANVFYKTGSAEVLPFPDASVQLITVSTALHWFDLEKFFAEARRILCNNGILAVYAYLGLKPLFKNPKLIEEVDKLYDEYYKNRAPYSKPQNKILFQKYKSINFPFEEVIRESNIRCLLSGKLSDIIGYVTTFSSFQNCCKKNPAKAEEIINKFRNRLYAVGAKENITPDQSVILYRDYFLVICKKVVSPES